MKNKSTDWSLFDGAHTHARLIRNGSLTASSLVTQHFTQIQKWNQRLNALTSIHSTLQDELALLKKTPIEDTGSKRLSGISFTAKDHISIAGMPRSEGSLRSPITTPLTSATLPELLFQEGAFCIGKGNMAELGKSYFTDNPIYGRTNNPFDLSRTSGGSTGGDAAAVAAGFCDIGLGGDVGGSIRVPANFCGVFGWYPTRGLLPENGIGNPWHPISHLFRNVGFLTRELQDLELLYSLTAVFDGTDPDSVPPLEYHPLSKRFAYFSEMNGVRAHPAIRQTLTQAVSRLEKLGYQGEEVTPPSFEASFGSFIILAGQAALAIEDAMTLAFEGPPPGEKEGPIVANLRSRIQKELPPLTTDNLLLALSRVYEERSRIAAFFSSYAFVISPVAATLPPLHDTSCFHIEEQELYSQQVFQFANAVNFLALPAIAFPTEKHIDEPTKTPLPLGLQIVGPRFSDRFLMEVLKGIQYQKSLTSDLLAL